MSSFSRQRAVLLNHNSVRPPARNIPAIAYAESVFAGSPGLTALRGLPWVNLPIKSYPKGVIAHLAPAHLNPIRSVRRM